MTNIVHIIPEPSNIKNNIKKVEKRIKEASDEISKAKRELNNANHSELSYEINQLESMYKKNNQYASEFETFASKVETMVNEYITTDKNCANKIRSNGKSHRQKTGLPKGLGAALISSTFEKLGDIIDDISDSIKEWVSTIVEEFMSNPIIEKILDDWDSVLQLIQGVAQLGISGVILWGAVAACLAGAALPVALPVVVAAGFTFILGFDKSVSAGVDLLDKYETNGSSIIKDELKKILPDFVVEFVYDTVDGISTAFTTGGASAIANNAKYVKWLDYFRKIEDSGDKIKWSGDGVKFINNLNDEDGGFIKAFVDLISDKLKYKLSDGKWVKYEYEGWLGTLDKQYEGLGFLGGR